MARASKTAGGSRINDKNRAAERAKARAYAAKGKSAAGKRAKDMPYGWALPKGGATGSAKPVPKADSAAKPKPKPTVNRKEPEGGWLPRPPNKAKINREKPLGGWLPNPPAKPKGNAAGTKPKPAAKSSSGNKVTSAFRAAVDKYKAADKRIHAGFDAIDAAILAQVKSKGKPVTKGQMERRATSKPDGKSKTPKTRGRMARSPTASTSTRTTKAKPSSTGGQMNRRATSKPDGKSKTPSTRGQMRRNTKGK